MLSATHGFKTDTNVATVPLLAQHASPWGHVPVSAWVVSDQTLPPKGEPGSQARSEQVISGMREVAEVGGRLAARR